MRFQRSQFWLWLWLIAQSPHTGGFAVANSQLLAAAAAAGGVVRPGAAIPTTSPARDDTDLRYLEAGGVLVANGRRFASTLVWSDHWDDAFVYDAELEVWIPLYGWRAGYLTADGRLLVLERPGEARSVRVAELLAREPGDFDRDGDVDMSDFGRLQARMGSSGPPGYDLNGDGRVDGRDVGVFERLAKAAKR